MSLTRGIVRAAVLASVVILALGAATIDFAKGPTASIQPMGVAFPVIWCYIYLSVAVSGALYAGTDVFPLTPALLAAASLVLMWFWVIAAREEWLISLAVVIGFAAVLAWMAVVVCPVVSSKAATWLVQSALGVYAGWLTVATLVNIANYDDNYDTPIALLFTAVLGAMACAVAARPFPLFSVLWALALQPQQSKSTLTAIGFVLFGAVAAIWHLMCTLKSGSDIPLRADVE
eukprot:gnl/TRDRNA2_/TRDRNA2_208798_c0_seq1.p1 gnl/TRDRNA2_/TRDRNA2_208798_c0~~gnl/TRDRNA2_/TRDRNA2_208798_c0_seq1.p1  ORF type:complete len:232 (+),score=21.20 gnl/TRDRNA2_/TRDRNA2_208798_c0_seq1:79-774(+)